MARIKVLGETGDKMLVLNPRPYDFSAISTPYIVVVSKNKPRVLYSVSTRELYLEKEELEKMKVYREIDVPVYSADVYEPSDPCFTARSVEYFAIEVSPVASNENEILEKFANNLVEVLMKTKNIYNAAKKALREVLAYVTIPRNALATVTVPETKQNGPVVWREGTLAVAPIHPSLHVAEVVKEIVPRCGPDGYALHAVKISIFKNGEKILETSKSFSA